MARTLTREVAVISTTTLVVVAPKEALTATHVKIRFRGEAGNFCYFEAYLTGDVYGGVTVSACAGAALAVAWPFWRRGSEQQVLAALPVFLVH